MTTYIGQTADLYRCILPPSVAARSIALWQAPPLALLLWSISCYICDSKRLTIAHDTFMKKQTLQALFGWLCVSALTSCGSQRALHFAQRTTLDPNANTIQVDDKPIIKVATSALKQHQSSMPSM